MTMVTSHRENKKAETRARILKEGIRLIGERGLDTLTVDEIAIAAEVGKGTIYNYFSTKEEIVLAFMMELEQKVQRRAVRLAANGSLEEALTAFIAYQFRLKKPYFKFVRIFLAQMYARTEQFFPYIAELQTIIDPPLILFFESLQRRGVLRSDAPMPELLLHFKTMHLGLTSTWAMEGPPWKESERLLPRLVQLFCQGLKENAK